MRCKPLIWCKGLLVVYPGAFLELRWQLSYTSTPSFAAYIVFSSLCGFPLWATRLHCDGIESASQLLGRSTRWLLGTGPSFCQRHFYTARRCQWSLFDLSSRWGIHVNLLSNITPRYCPEAFSVTSSLKMVKVPMSEAILCFSSCWIKQLKFW